LTGEKEKTEPAPNPFFAPGEPWARTHATVDRFRHYRDEW
jgi:hypothetical protein